MMSLSCIRTLEREECVRIAQVRAEDRSTVSPLKRDTSMPARSNVCGRPDDKGKPGPDLRGCREAANLSQGFAETEILTPRNSRGRSSWWLRN